MLFSYNILVNQKNVCNNGFSEDLYIYYKTKTKQLLQQSDGRVRIRREQHESMDKSQRRW